MENIIPQTFGHVMVDIESFANDSNSAIVSIGAVEFNLHNGNTGKEFYINVDLQTCLDVGLHVSASTIMWWMKQSEEARMALVNGKTAHIAKALLEFGDFIESCGGKNCQIWGNGSRFDLGVLADAYKKVSLNIPWDFRNERDVRTLVSFAPEIKSMTKFRGTAHNAIDDCHHQIKYCYETFSHINGRN